MNMAKVSLLCVLFAIVAVVNGDECWDKFRGVCVSMQLGYCPFNNGGFSWIGCPKGEMCCFPKRETPTKPPEVPKDCGLRQIGADSFRIVGGWNASIGAWPWVVSIESSEKDDPHLCGAALIDDRWLVTAGHCFMDSTDPGLYRAVIGQHNRQQRLGHEQFIDVEIILVHEKFNDPYKANDIALVRLAKPVEFDDYAQPVCLATADDDFEGDVCTVVGWGIPVMFTQVQMSVLQEVNLPVLEHDYCEERVDPFYKTNMCAGYKYGTRDACGGDSGGPLMCKSLGSKHWKLVGVISWGKGCARPDNPGVYTDISQYLDWIKDKVE